MTCLLGVVELFVLVKGVGDVLAGRWSWVLTFLSASRSWGALDDEEFFVIEGSGWR